MYQYTYTFVACNGEQLPCFLSPCDCLWPGWFDWLHATIAGSRARAEMHVLARCA